VVGFFEHAHQPLVSIREGNSLTTMSEEGFCFKHLASYILRYIHWELDIEILSYWIAIFTVDL